MSSVNSKNFIKYVPYALMLGGLLVTSGCGIGNNTIFFTVDVDRPDITVAQKGGVVVMVNNPYQHELEFRYVADRGQIIQDQKIPYKAVYYAPFTGGADIVRVTIFDKTANSNLPEGSRQIMVGGESIAYVELPSGATALNDTENGKIKISTPRSAGETKDMGFGRTPTISPDGKYIAYTTFPGDGSSQIVVKDPLGNEINLTNHKSFNNDPEWSPIGKDGQLYMVFSSDRMSSAAGTSLDEHGDKYHLWRANYLGSELKQLTSTAGNDFQPSWSPDGKSIAFSSDFDQNKSNNFKNIWILDIQSGNQVEMTHESIANMGGYNPSWSPDNTKLVYSRKYKYREYQALQDMQKIWMIELYRNAEGFGKIVTRQFDATISEDYPSWSPGGYEISYIRAKGREAEVVSVPVAAISQIRGSATDPTPLGSLTNVIEAQWARQKIYNSYTGGYGNSPFAPTDPFAGSSSTSSYTGYSYTGGYNTTTGTGSTTGTYGSSSTTGYGTSTGTTGYGTTTGTTQYPSY